MAEEECSHWDMKAIGYIESCFKRKNGTPRQPIICEASRAKLTINRQVFSNPEHALDGLLNYSHVWVIFVFHKNNNAYTKAKVRPPRLNGAKVGLFSTRSPYRPNPIGLTLARVEKVEGSTIHLIGIDMLDGTPVLDIKPYIPNYDQPMMQPSDSGGNDVGDSVLVGTTNKACETHSESTLEIVESLTDDKKENVQMDNVASIDIAHVSEPYVISSSKSEVTVSEPSCECTASKTESPVKGSIKESPTIVHDISQKQSGGSCEAKTSIASWVDRPAIDFLTVRLTPTAEAQLQMFSKESSNPMYELTFLNDHTDAKQAIIDILEADPRSTYRRKKCIDRLYFFILDTLHITVWFDDCDNVAEVVRIMPLTERSKMLVTLDVS